MLSSLVAKNAHMSHMGGLGLVPMPKNGARPESWLNSTEQRVGLAQVFPGPSHGPPLADEQN